MLAASGTTAHSKHTGDQAPASASHAVVVPFPRLPEFDPFDPDAEPPCDRMPPPTGVTDTQYRVWDTIRCGITRTGDIAGTLGISDRRVRVLVNELEAAGHLTRSGRGQYTVFADSKELNA